MSRFLLAATGALLPIMAAAHPIPASMAVGIVGTGSHEPGELLFNSPADDASQDDPRISWATRSGLPFVDTEAGHLLAHDGFSYANGVVAMVPRLDYTVVSVDDSSTTELFTVPAGSIFSITSPLGFTLAFTATATSPTAFLSSVLPDQNGTVFTGDWSLTGCDPVTGYMSITTNGSNWGLVATADPVAEPAAWLLLLPGAMLLLGWHSMMRSNNESS